MLGFVRNRHARQRTEWIRSVVGRYESLLLRYAWRRTGDRDQAEDLVQAALLKLIEHPHIGEADIPQWLYTVLRNEFLDRCRATTVTQKYTADLGESLVEAQALAILERSDDLDCLMTALSALKPVERQVIELRFIEEHSYREIGRHIHKSESHVGVILHQALKRLRSVHEKHCGDYLEGGAK